jgi:hypothetical protein
MDDLPDQATRDFVRRFTRKTRFLVDESLGIGVAKVLRDFGFNAVFAPDLGLGGNCDKDVFAYAWRQDRIILTHDADFLDDRRFPPPRNPGLVILPGASGLARGLVDALRVVIRVIAPFREAYRGDKIRISEEGEWVVTGFSRELGRHYKHRYRFGSHGQMWQWTDDDSAGQRALAADPEGAR